MYDDEIERFKEKFYAEGTVRRRRKKGRRKGGNARDYDDRQSNKKRDKQRKAERGDRDRFAPTEAEVLARDAAALEEERLDLIREQEEQEARKAELAEMNDEISVLGETQISIRHKAPSGIPTSRVLIDKWKELEAAGKAASPDTDEDLEDLRDQIDQVVLWLESLDSMFSSDKDGEALYDYAVRNRPIRDWPAVTGGTKTIESAIKWPYPDKTAYLAGLDVIRTAKLECDAALVNLAALKGDWQAARAKVVVVQKKVDTDTVRIRKFPAVDDTFVKLDKVFGGQINAELLAADFLPGVTTDIQRLDNWAVVVVDKVDGIFFQFLEQAIAQRQPKTDVERWDFESERDALKKLLFETAVVTGGQIQAGFDTMLKKLGPWTSGQKFAEAQEAADKERTLLSVHFSGTWACSPDVADAKAKTYYAINSRALAALTRNALTLATFDLLEVALNGADAALNLLLGIPSGANTVRLARCLSNQQINDTNVWARIQAGDAAIEYTTYFPYRGTIEVELTVKWAAVGMPGRVDWCVVHIHYYGTVANAAGFHFAHLKEWTVRQAGSSSSGAPGNFLVNHVKGIVHPKGLTL